jgi:hypothetical protein
MSNINDLVFEALQNTSNNDTSNSNSGTSKSQSQPSSNNSKGFGAPSVSSSKSSVTFSKPTVTPMQRPGMITKPGNPTSPDFMKKNKPKFGLGSGKSLMGW